jgi:hypothetical protein
VFAVILVEQLEHGFADLLGEPDDGAAGDGRSPRHGADQPRVAQAGELAGGGGIELEFHGRVALQETGGERVCRGFLHGVREHAGLGLAPGEEQDAARLEDGADAHGDGMAGDVGLAEEIAGGVAPGEGVERDEAGARVAAGAGLIEADVAGAADAEDLHVEATGGADLFLVGPAPRENLRPGHGAVGDVDVGGRDVEVVEELLVHEPPVALGVRARQAVVFVEIEGHDVFEAQLLLAVQPDELAVETHRGGAGGQAEHGRPAGRIVAPDQGGQFGRHQRAGDVGRGMDDALEALALLVLGERSHGAASISSTSRPQYHCMRGRWKGPFQVLPLSRVDIRPSRWA